MKCSLKPEVAKLVRAEVRKVLRGELRRGVAREVRRILEELEPPRSRSVHDTEPAPPPKGDWDTLPSPDSDRGGDPSDAHDPASRTVL